LNITWRRHCQGLLIFTYRYSYIIAVFFLKFCFKNEGGVTWICHLGFAKTLGGIDSPIYFQL
jgi:hypothetical protein